MARITVVEYVPELFEEVTVTAQGLTRIDALRCRACGWVVVGSQKLVPVHDCAQLTEAPPRSQEERQEGARRRYGKGSS